MLKAVFYLFLIVVLPISLCILIGWFFKEYPQKTSPVADGKTNLFAQLDQYAKDYPGWLGKSVKY